jgi:Cu+-exporting ATPase
MAAIEIEPAPLHHYRLKVDGMTCANCAKSAEKALRNIPGVEDAQVNFALEKADVRTGETSIPYETLFAALTNAGYEGQEWSQSLKQDETKEARISSDTWHLALALLLSLPLVLPMLRIGVPNLLPFAQLALTLPIQFWLGFRFYKGAYQSLRSGTANMDVLVVLGTTAAFIYSLVLLALSAPGTTPHLYFEASAVIVTLVLVGKWLEDRAKRGAGEAIRHLMALRPEVAHLIRGGAVIDIMAEDVLPGDQLLVRPGERFPVDGDVTEGQTEADLSHITGESLPVLLKPGNKAYSGALNGTGAVEFRASAVAEASLLGRIIEMVESAQSGKAPVQKLVDQISAIFVPTVVALSVLTFSVWFLSGSTFEQSILPAIAVLVIACPCALGLATPTALVAGLGAAAKSGILIRDIEALERAYNIDTVVFDKTGTLTQGLPEVRKIVGADEHEVLQVAASIQVASEHLLGKAILDAAHAGAVPLLPSRDFSNYVGEGVSALIAGVVVAAGNKSLMARLSVDIDAYDPETLDPGSTRIFVSKGKTCIGAIELADRARATSKPALTALKAQGLYTVLLSGDAMPTAEAIGQEVGIDLAIGDLKPEDKVAWIKDQQALGKKIAMVGDGVNDAPALAQADMGIAMGSGTDVAMATAGITLMQSDPRLVAASLNNARATRRKIRQNLGWAFVYNVVGLPLAALGLLSPAFAAGAMAASSVSVVSNSLLLRRWRPNLKD